jgi:hypothetical protein
MMLKSKYFHGVGTFEVHLLKVSALKLSHPSACPVFKDFEEGEVISDNANIS